MPKMYTKCCGPSWLEASSCSTDRGLDREGTTRPIDAMLDPLHSYKYNVALTLQDSLFVFVPSLILSFLFEDMDGNVVLRRTTRVSSSSRI